MRLMHVENVIIEYSSVEIYRLKLLWSMMGILLGLAACIHKSKIKMQRSSECLSLKCSEEPCVFLRVIRPRMSDIQHLDDTLSCWYRHLTQTSY